MSDKQDPRFRQHRIQETKIDGFFGSYRQELATALDSVSIEAIEKTAQLLLDALQRKAKILVAGNGGSAAITDHLCCDWSKGTRVPQQTSLQTFSLSSNSALITALGNDFGFEEIFSTQVSMYGQKGDVLVLISSSGNSPNILQAAKEARKAGLSIIGFTGFSGGELKKLADISIHVDCSNYGIVEDSHQTVMHVVGQYISNLRDTSSQVRIE